MAKSYTDYLKEILLSQKTAKDDEIEAVNSASFTEKEKTKDQYAKKIREADKNYTSKVQEENIKKLIEQRKFNEAMGNMGLSDSGYKNSMDKFSALKHQQKKDKAKSENDISVASLEKEMKDELQQIENERLKDVSKIEESFLKDAENTAESLYKADLKQRKNTVTLKDEKEPEGEREIPEDTEKTKEPEQEPEKPKEPEEPEEEKIVLTKFQEKNVNSIIKNLPTRREYLREKKLDPSLPDFGVYLKNLLEGYVRREELSEKEYYYILNFYNVR